MSTNQELADHDPLFRKACELAGLPPTRRLASKWRRQTGTAYKYKREAEQLLYDKEKK